MKQRLFTLFFLFALVRPALRSLLHYNPRRPADYRPRHLTADQFSPNHAFFIIGRLNFERTGTIVFGGGRC